MVDDKDFKGTRLYKPVIGTAKPSQGSDTSAEKIQTVSAPTKPLEELKEKDNIPNPSSQLETLKNAAENGTPFCEICS